MANLSETQADREIGEQFSRIESAVAAGSGLTGTGFWPLVARLKRDPALAEHWAARAGEIDSAAFRAGVRFRIPVLAGNALLSAGIVIGALAVVVAMRTRSPVVAGLALIFAAGDWTTCVHCPAHW